MTVVWLWCWPGEDDSFLLVFGLVYPCDTGEVFVTDVQLFVDAVEKGFAEWAALEIGDCAVQEAYAGYDVWMVVRDIQLPMREDAQPSLECIDPVHVQQRQSLAAKQHLVLPDGLLDQIPVSVAFVLTPGQSLDPAVVKCEFANGFGDGSVQETPGWFV